MEETRPASNRQEQGVVYARGDYAGFWRRIAVDLIDFTLLLFAIMAITLSSTLLVPAAEWLPHVLFWSSIGLTFVYLVLLKRSRFRTLGYAVGGIRIVNLQGERPSIWALTIRAMFAILGPVNMLVDIMWITSDPRRQALRDKFAHTYVIRAGATPIGQGTVMYSAYTILAVNFLFAEVRPVSGEGP